jgi:hypothetical protein
MFLAGKNFSSSRIKFTEPVAGTKIHCGGYESAL